MTEDRYFDKFPIIKYNGVQAVDIMRRVAPLRGVQRNSHVVHPYELSSYERADQFSNRYYNDPYKSWMVYLINDINDPYYSWYLEPTEFRGMLEKKYGSVYAAQSKTYYYRNNWAAGNDIAISTYDALTPRQKAYFTPLYGVGDRISGYTRKREDWQIATNQIVKYNVANSGFTKNEIVTIHFSNGVEGRGQISSTTTDSIHIMHTSGYTVPSDVAIISGNSYITGSESGVNTVFTTARSEVKSLEPEEEVYWAPVSYYEYENERNEYNKTIIVLDNRFAQKTVDELTKLMKE